jgi:hypothetical protein
MLDHPQWVRVLQEVDNYQGELTHMVTAYRVMNFFDNVGRAGALCASFERGQTTWNNCYWGDYDDTWSPNTRGIPFR